MGKYQGYPEYEPINAEWFSEIPTGWSVTPLKHVATIQHGAITKFGGLQY